MTWFRKEKQPIETPKEKRVQTEGLWVKCDGCRQIIWKKDLEDNFNVCPKCNHHGRITRTRFSDCGKRKNPGTVTQ